MFGPRGVLHCVADGKGGQTIQDTGPLTKKRMETIDEEITDAAIEWIEKQAKAEKPLWYNSTAMHFRSHVAEKNRGKSGQDEYSDRMVVHDEQIGMTLDKLDELGIAEDTIVMYSTDNGPNDTWPDGANTPFRSQKDTNWEGGWRVPRSSDGRARSSRGLHRNRLAPGHAADVPRGGRRPEINEKLLGGYKANGKTFKVHIDGVNMLPYLTGHAKESPRDAFFYFSDDGDLMALRYKDWKFVLEEQTADKMRVWMEPPKKLRVPLIFNLRRDPFERAQHNSNTYYDWMISRAFLLYGMQAVVAQQIQAFKEFPPRQRPASFNLDEVMRQFEGHK